MWRWTCIFFLHASNTQSYSNTIILPASFHSSTPSFVCSSPFTLCFQRRNTIFTYSSLPLTITSSLELPSPATCSSPTLFRLHLLLLPFLLLDLIQPLPRSSHTHRCLPPCPVIKNSESQHPRSGKVLILRILISLLFHGLKFCLPSLSSSVYCFLTPRG